MISILINSRYKRKFESGTTWICRWPLIRRTMCSSAEITVFRYSSVQIYVNELKFKEFNIFIDAVLIYYTLYYIMLTCLVVKLCTIYCIPIHATYYTHRYIMKLIVNCFINISYSTRKLNLGLKYMYNLNLINIFKFMTYYVELFYQK